MRQALSVLLLASPLFAADVVVTPGQSIQTAIDAASPGDRLLVQPGTYLETLDFGGKTIAVIGVGGPEQTVLDGDGVGPVVRFANGEGPDTRLSGLTITNGHASMGAGGVVASSGATPTLSDCIVRQNTGKFGGGISGSPILERCAILDNSASLTHGGGVYGAPQMSHCVVAGNTNTSARGGGLYLVGGSGQVVLRDCVIVGNRSLLGDGGRGGGVYVDSTVDATLERCVIADNTAAGGVFGSYGGGLYVESAGTVLDHCDVLDNHLSATATTGGAIYGPAELISTTVRGNAGTQLVNVGAISYSNIEGGAAGVGNIDADPLYVDAAGDQHLLPGSPCIGAGQRGSDIGALGHASLYVTPSLAWPGDEVNAPQLSVSLEGDAVGFSLLGDPSDAGRGYLLLAGLSGSTPGQGLPLVHVPLTFDGFTDLALTLLNTPILPGAFGQLDGLGRASAGFDTLVSFNPGLVGVELTFAWVLMQPVDFASNPLTVALVP